MPDYIITIIIIIIITQSTTVVLLMFEVPSCAGSTVDCRVVHRTVNTSIY